jgi:hypothetical protein
MPVDKFGHTDTGVSQRVIVGGVTLSQVNDLITKSLKKCHVGYIPLLEADESVTGFVASSSSCSTSSQAYYAFTNLIHDGHAAWISRDDVTVWLQIKCPEPVKIWRIALDALITGPNWNLSASNDGLVFTPLYTSSTGLLIISTVPIFFNISITDAYQYYRITIPESGDGISRAINVMQLYVYDT